MIFKVFPVCRMGSFHTVSIFINYQGKCCAKSVCASKEVNYINYVKLELSYLTIGNGYYPHSLSLPLRRELLLKSGQEFFLIDSGITKKRTQIEGELRNAGCKPVDLRLIIITHGHNDHVGNAAYLKETYSSKIAMHTDDRKMVESGDMFRGTRGGSDRVGRILHEGIWPQ